MEELNKNTQNGNADPAGNGDDTGKLFTQDEVNRIVADRLARERGKQKPQEDEREKTLAARESRLDCREYVAEKKYPAALLDALDTSDAEKFKAAADKLVTSLPGMVESAAKPTGQKIDVGGKILSTPSGGMDQQIANIFKPQ